MSERNNKLELLGSAPIPKALMALGIPIMIGMLINALYNLVDAYFVGGLGESQMGAISVVFPLGQVVVGLGLMFGNGAASYLSRLLGRGDKDTANRVASTALYSSILIGAIIILFSTIFLKPILAMLGATETIMPYALTYARIYVLSCIFNVFNVTMNNIVSSEGAAKGSGCSNCHSNFANGIHTCLSNLCSSQKKRIFLQCKSVFSYGTNDGGNFENWNSYFSVPTADKSFDCADQPCIR